MSVLLMTHAFKAALPTTQKFVLVALCDSANDQGECYPSITTLMEKCSLSDRAVQKALNDLEETGYMRREYRTGRSTVYWLTPDAPTPPNDVHPRTSFTPNHVHPTPERRSPITVIEPSVEPSKKQRAGKPAQSKPAVEAIGRDALIADGVSEEAADEFIALRRRKRAPLTPLSWKGFKAEVVKAGWSIDDAVRKSVQRGWQSFDAEWVQGDARRSTAPPDVFAGAR